mmetsp:Transcript_68834/g.206438  ORF Transcript_68834/g.206438 Transcript_68834/m.206438 type:complete len:224 (+) Transcript_68834:1181-1852(+)
MRRGGLDGADRFGKHHAAHGALLRVALERGGERLVQVAVEQVLRRRLEERVEGAAVPLGVCLVLFVNHRNRQPCGECSAHFVGECRARAFKERALVEVEQEVRRLWRGRRPHKLRPHHFDAGGAARCGLRRLVRLCRLASAVLTAPASNVLLEPRRELPRQLWAATPHDRLKPLASCAHREPRKLCHHLLCHLPGVGVVGRRVEHHPAGEHEVLLHEGAGHDQ